MKKFLSLFVALIATTYLWAEDFEVDGIYYLILTSETNEVQVTFRGESYDSYNDEYIDSVIIPETVSYNGTTYSVTSIGNAAFRNCSSLVSITIPNSITSIETNTFSSCSSLTSITIPNSVTSIGASAFASCSSLTSINIPNGVTSIEGYAFFRCSSLTSINIPNSITSIERYAFYNCSSLTSINIPNGVTSIGASAFASCSSLTSINIPNGVTSIGDLAFSGCSSLTSVVWNVKNYADFSERSKNPLYSIRSQITSFTFGDSVEYTPANLCYGMDNLTSIVWNSKSCADFKGVNVAPLYDIRTQITSFTFGESVEDIPAYLCFGMDNLTSIIIPNSVTSIGDRAFTSCSSLTSVNIPNGVTSIGDYAFNACSSLTSITIGNSVTSIGNYAFYNCSSLTSVTIPNSVTTIGDEAFAGRTKLYDIYCYAMAPPTAYKSSFVNYNAFVYVPCDALRYYQADMVWGEFKHLQCIDSEDVTTDGITVTPSTNDVTIIWPTEDNADTYTIVIKKDGEVFCTLTFNAEGQLLNIVFAPGRDGNRPAQYAEQAVNGYRFTVTGLTEATRYAYNITTKDAANKTIATYSGEFTTMGGVATSIEDILHSTTNCQKIIRNGQLIIIRDGVEYNAMGQEL